MPVDHRIVQNADGSGTVWVGETEPVYRMRWLVGITIFPGRSYLRCDYVFINPTESQAALPVLVHRRHPRQRVGTGAVSRGHGDRPRQARILELARPQRRRPHLVEELAERQQLLRLQQSLGLVRHLRPQGPGRHGARGRSQRAPRARNSGRGARGRRDASGKTYSPEGGGAYFEPQAGVWSDNQPDYHWMWPHEVKTAHDYWYPVRDTRGYHNANEDFAVNTELQNGKAFVAVYSTAVAKYQKIVLKNATVRSRAGGEDGHHRARQAVHRGGARRRPTCPSTTCTWRFTVPTANSGSNCSSNRPGKSNCRPARRIQATPKKMTQDELYRFRRVAHKFVATEEACRITGRPSGRTRPTRG